MVNTNWSASIGQAFQKRLLGSEMPRRVYPVQGRRTGRHREAHDDPKHTDSCATKMSVGVRMNCNGVWSRIFAKHLGNRRIDARIEGGRNTHSEKH